MNGGDYNFNDTDKISDNDVTITEITIVGMMATMLALMRLVTMKTLLSLQ